MTGEPRGEAARATTGRRVMRDTLWVGLSRVNPQLNALLLSIVAAHILGDDDLGRQSFIAFVEISIIALLAESFATAISRHVARAVGADEHDLVRPLYRWAQATAVLPALLAGGVMFSLAMARPDLQAAWIVAGISAMLNCLNRIPTAVLGGMQRWRLLAIGDFFLTIGGTIIAIALLNLGYGITGIFWSEVIVSATSLTLWSIMVRPALAAYGRPGVRLNVDLRREATRYALLLTAGMLVTLIVWRRSEFIFLDAFSVDSQIAMYSIAFAAVSALTQLPQALAIVALPAFATLDGARSDQRTRMAIGRVLRLTILVSLPITAAALAGGPAILAAVYPSEFDEAGTVLLIMLATFPPVCLILLVNGILQGVGRQRFPIIIGAVGAALDIALALLLIPDYGARGAAVATAIAQLAAGVPAILYVDSVIGGVDWPWRRIGACLGASAAGFLAMSEVMVMVPGILGVLPGLIVGGAAFMFIALLAPIMSSGDAQWVIGLTSGRGERLLARLGRLDLG